jgi:hypothetical protein
LSQTWEAQWEEIINRRIQAAVNDALERAEAAVRRVAVLDAKPGEGDEYERGIHNCGNACVAAIRALKTEAP